MPRQSQGPFDDDEVVDLAKELTDVKLGGAIGKLTERIAGHWTLDDQRWVSHHHQHETADTARLREAALQQRAVEIAEAARSEALRISNDALTAYKASANEFRGTLEDQAAHFVTKSEFESALNRVTVLENDRIARDAAAVTSAKSESDTKARESAERTRQQWVTGIVVGFVSIALSATVALILRLAFPS